MDIPPNMVFLLNLPSIFQLVSFHDITLIISLIRCGEQYWSSLA